MASRKPRPKDVWLRVSTSDGEPTMFANGPDEKPGRPDVRIIRYIPAPPKKRSKRKC